MHIRNLVNAISSTLAVCTAAFIGPSTSQAQDAEELARQLANPVANLISVPLQFNYDRVGDLDRFVLNIQPVIPFSLGEDWNLITRTIIPVASLSGDGVDEQGLGDVVQSFFLSPKAPTSGGWIWGAGPVFLYPTGTDAFSSDTFAAGPTVVALRQQGPWTYGGLANHLWSIGEDDTPINATFLQPFVTYGTPSGTSFTLQTESTYDWEADSWSVPIFAGVTQVTSIGSQPVSIGGGIRYWAESPAGGPEGWGARLNLTLLFPK